MPGYGYARISFNEKKRWSELVEGYFAKSKNIKLVVQIVDMRHTPSEQDFQMIDFLYSNHIPFVIVASKCDKLNKTQRNVRNEEFSKELSQYNDIERVPFSSFTGEGISKIKDTINGYFQ